MKYTKEKDVILIENKTEFCAKHILECGQVFRYKLLANGDYKLIAGDKFATIKETDLGYQIITKDVDYFENYFDLKNDYSLIKQTLAKDNDTLQKATNYGYGIRILNQQPLEMIISFIISANNNIKRIQLLVERLSEKCGTNMGEYFAFPTLEQLQTLSVDDLKAMGMGFRAKYIFETAKKLKNVDLESLRSYENQKLLDFLLGFDGVGPKVADCIALFAYHDMNCFPVDTWVEKIYNSFFAKTPEKNRVKIRQNLTEMFGNLSGYAQQYLFYYKRELDKSGIDN